MKRKEELEERKKLALFWCFFLPLCVLDDAVRGSCLQGPLMVNVDQSGVSGLESVKM